MVFEKADTGIDNCDTMREIKIEHLAYLLKQAKAKNKPQPIFFLGAGASRSGQIPLAGEIITKIQKDYSDYPFIKELPEKERTYAKLMSCLLPDERDELLKKYIDEAKVNVTHIYLAQLIKEGYVDYVLTVNFDNLMLRALALYNIFPSTYDMAILKDLTTSTFKKQSVVYLHGQNHGLWLLNTPEEMEKVKNTVPRIFDSIKNRRPWVFLGYSGEDPVFEHVKNLGRFDNGLYWIGYQDNSPNENVQGFISDPNTNASIIKGYDSDSFMLKLNRELGLPQPMIVDKPFTALKNMLEEIVDIDEKEHFKGVKERMDISKRQVDEAIQQFELGKQESLRGLDENKIDLLKKEIINLIISEKYDESVISEIESRAKESRDNDIKALLAALYSNWGVYLGNLAKNKDGEEAEVLYLQSFDKYRKAIEMKSDEYNIYYNWGSYLGFFAQIKEGYEAEVLYEQSFEQFRKAIELKSDYHNAYYNWGICLGNLAKTKVGDEADVLYEQSFEKFRRVIEIKSDCHKAYHNWGVYLGYLADTKDGKESDALYQLSFDKYSKALEIKPNDYIVYNSWGLSLGNLAKNKVGKESEELYQQCFDKCRKAIELKPDYYDVYNNWGVNLGNLAKTKKGVDAEELYLQSFDKFQEALEIKPDYNQVYNNWSICLMNLAQAKEGQDAEELYQQSLDKCFKALDLGGKCYNLACLYAIKDNIKEALHYLDLSLSKEEISVKFVEKDNDWKNYLSNPEFIEILNRYR